MGVMLVSSCPVLTGAVKPRVWKTVPDHNVPTLWFGTWSVRVACWPGLHCLLGRPVERHKEVLSDWPLLESEVCLLS